MILVGSAAARRNNLDLAREGQLNEYDLIVSGARLPALLKFLSPIAQLRPIDKNHAAVISPPVGEGHILDLELAWPGSSGEFLVQVAEYEEWPTVLIPFGEKQLECRVASPSVLYALKMSHRYKKNSPHFLKTMRDIQMMRTQLSTDMAIWCYGQWFKKREAETYNYAHPSLMQSKKNFFNDDGIQYVYDHDDIHRVVAEPLRPAYQAFAKAGEEVYSSRELFERCDHFTKLRAVFEETCVLALERSQIPFRIKHLDPRLSFNIAHEKVCTSITSGWFREFAWEHFDEVQAMFNPHYADHFFEHADEGNVKPFRRAA